MSRFVFRKICKRAAIACALVTGALVAGGSQSGCDDDLLNKTSLGLDDAPEGRIVTKVSFTRPVTATVPAGENVIITYEDKDLAVIDMSNPAAPGEPVVLVTNSKIIAVEYDDERRFAYAVDVNGTLWFV